MAKTLADLLEYLNLPSLQAEHRPWIIQHLAASDGLQSDLQTMLNSFVEQERWKTPLRRRMKQKPLPRLIRDGVVKCVGKDIYRLNAELTPPEVTELVRRCEAWRRQWRASSLRKRRL